MDDFTTDGRRFFATPHYRAHRPRAAAPRYIGPFRDRLARGYYDRPDLTDAAVARMLKKLSADYN